jgi:hypothetical protein
MKKFLLKIAYFIMTKYKEPIIRIPDSIILISSLIKTEVTETSAMQGLYSNEYRHSHTYAALKKNLPDVKSRDIGLGIELVLYGLL